MSCNTGSSSARAAASAATPSSCKSKRSGAEAAVALGVVALQPLDDLDLVAVRVAEEEAVAVWDLGCLVDGHALRSQLFAGGLGVVNVQGKVSRADRVGRRLQQQVQRLPAAEVEPEGDEVEGLRGRDLFQSEYVAVEAP